MSNDIPDDWKPLLSHLNSLLMTSGEWEEFLTPEARSTGRFGSPPALDSEIHETEKRLGITLPPSYRSFLSISNGWFPFDSLIERLLPVQQTEWLRVADPESAVAVQGYFEETLTDKEYLDYDKHSEAMRPRYYPDCLLIGKAWPSETELILLNPRITFPDQEWEAIFYAHWLPGNTRFRTFRDLFVKRVEVFEMIEASRSQ